MTMPGFSAESSLYKTGDRYSLAAVFNARQDGEVQPQIGRELACYLRCLEGTGPEEGWSDLCAYFCTHR